MPRFRFSLLKMKMPPLLMGATLLFWGWQTGFLFEGGVMASFWRVRGWLKYVGNFLMTNSLGSGLFAWCCFWPP